MKVTGITEKGMNSSLHLVTASLGRTRGRAAFLLILANLACGPLPRDPEKTSERVQQERQLRVGVVENPPWVICAGNEPAGIEVELVRKFAASLGASPKWFWGSGQKHMEALERF